jgi:hypothetical protein
MPSITITVDPVQYLAACTAVVGLILAGYWCGRADRRDGRVLGGIRENDARFEQMRAVRERGTRRLAEALATLHAVSLPVVDRKPQWVAGQVVDDSDPVPDADREVESGDEDYPPERAAFGAGRLPVEQRDGGELAVWPANGRGPGQHRLRGDDAQDLRVRAAAFHEPGVIAP